MSDHATYLKIGHEYQPIPPAETNKRLPPGVYTVKFDPSKNLIAFGETKITHDELIDLPGTAYDLVMSDLDWFFTPECASRFTKVKLLQKMNMLLYGVPGGGKTCIVNRVALRVIEENGIVLFNPNPHALKEVFRTLDLLQPDTRVLVIFEELDQLIAKYEEGVFLHILDGEVQKANAMFIATTNYINKVPKRIRRPGRFPVRMEVGLPSLEARVHYCKLKLSSDLELATQIAELTENFNIDQLKDVIRAHYCMKKDLNTVLADLRAEFDIPTQRGALTEVQEEGDFDFDEMCETEEEAEGPSRPILSGRIT